MADTWMASVKDALLFPFDYCNAAVNDGKLLSKTLDLATSTHDLANKFFPACPFVASLGAVGKDSKPFSGMFKAFFDGVEPTKELLNEGSNWAVKARNCTDNWYQNEFLGKLVAKVSLVVGIWLALPVFLGSVGAITLPAALTVNVGTASVFPLIDCTRFTMITAGTVHTLYKSVMNKAWQSPNVAKAQIALKNVQDTASPDTLHRQEKIKASWLKTAEYDLKKKQLGLGDDATKIALYAVTIFSSYVAPINALIGVVAFTWVNKYLGSMKTYYEVKLQEEQDSLESFRKDEYLTAAEIKAPWAK